MDFPAPSFSLLSSSESQGLTPSDSLSPLSEPPEIGEWFLSYRYESPELSIGEDLECSETVRGNDCEKEENDVEEESDKRKEENLGGFGKDEKKDLSVGNENLDSKGFVSCENAVGNNNFVSQVSGLPDSCLLISEPPDIKNWFSSYAYESPALGSSDIDFSEYKDDICDIEGRLNEKVIRANKDPKESFGRNDDFVGEQKASGGDNKSKRSLETNEEYCHKGNNLVDRDQATVAPTEVPFKSTAELVFKGKGAKDHDNTSTKVAENSSFKIKSPEKPNRELSGPAKSSVHNDDLSPKRSIHQRNVNEEGSEAETFQGRVSAQRERDRIAVNDDTLEKSSRSNNKENDGSDFAANSFVSTRKRPSRRENDENSLTNIVGDRSRRLQNGVRASQGGHNHKEGMVQRKVLSETTNIRRSDAMEVTGKWRCPQKSKPNLGPRLKQLRLERWVHRV